jgi:YesN/AraC family two-component response regulator
LLVVDDEHLIREGFANYDWERLGFVLAGEAMNGKLALQFIEMNNVDVVLADIRMPVMDGLELAEKLQERKQNCKIILLSRYKDFEYARSAINNRVFSYLLKPVGFDEIDEVFLRLKLELDTQTGDLTGQPVQSNYDTNTEYLIQNTKNYIALHYSSKLTLEDAANYAHLSPTYFSACFKKFTGMSYVQYLKQCRVSKAKELLRGSNMKINAISLAVGYGNTKYFCDAFKEFVGMSPQTYRLNNNVRET